MGSSGDLAVEMPRSEPKEATQWLLSKQPSFTPGAPWSQALGVGVECITSQIFQKSLIEQYTLNHI